MLDSTAMFVTYNSGAPIASAILDSPEGVLLISFRPTHWGFMFDMNTFKETLIRVLVKTAFTAIPLVMVFFVCIFFALVKNRISHGQWMLRETLEYILYEPIHQRPKLEKITFPTRVLSQGLLKIILL